MTPCFSPTQTQKFLRCPALWTYDRRWETRGPYRPEKDLGSALHAGLAELYRGGDGLAAARTDLEVRWPSDAPPDLSLESQWLTLKRVYGAVVKDVHLDGVPLGIELTMGPEQCRLDLLMKTQTGLQVVDWKYAHVLQPYALPRRLREYEHSHQLWHYAWRVSQEFPQYPVRLLTTILVIGSPQTKVRQVDVEVTPELLDSWAQGATQVWKVMELMNAGLTIPWKNYTSCDDFGGCPFWDGCHVLAGDESRFSTLYDKVV